MSINRTLVRPEYVVVVVCVLTAAGCSQRVPLANVSSQATEALRAAFPDATMEQVDSEYKNGVGIYEARLTRADQVMDVTVSHEGTIIEVESTVAMSDTPKAVADAISAAAETGTITKIEKVELRGAVRSGRIVCFDTPQMFYEVKYRKWGIIREVKVAPDGSPFKP